MFFIYLYAWFYRYVYFFYCLKVPSPLTHHYHYMFHDTRVPKQLGSCQHWIITVCPWEKSQTLHTYTPSSSPSSVIQQYFSLFIPLQLTYTHTQNTSTLLNSTVIVYIDFNIALSFVAWIAPHHHHGRPSRWGGPLRRSEVVLGLCGHPASSDLRTCEHKQEISVCTSLSHLSSSLLSDYNNILDVDNILL